MTYIKSWKECPHQVAQLVRACPIHQKDCGFNSQSGHMPELNVQTPVVSHAGGNCSVLLSHISIFSSLLSSFLLSSSYSVSSSSFPSSKINKKHISSGENYKE